MRTYMTFVFAAGTAARYSGDRLPSNPRGVELAGIEAPSISGFDNSTVQPSSGGLAVCVSGSVSVEASTSQNLKFNFELPKNQSDVTDTFLKQFTSGSSFLKDINGGKQTASGTFKIGATLCMPTSNTSPNQVQVLTHGVGFDRYYWDFAPGYSYVDVAAQYGHASFIYDRLGVGESTRADPLNVVQSPLEVEIANVLAQKLRNGAFSNIKFSKVVGVGHSFGSIITQAITAQYPDTFDAAILTGYTVNQTGVPAFSFGANFAIASQDQPLRFASLNNGYLVGGSVISNQIGFFRAPGFDPTMLTRVEATKETVTFGEFFSLSAVTTPAVNWKKPVAVVNGNEDLPFCNGNCSYPDNLSEAVFPQLYPNAQTTGAYSAEVAGHGLNLHYSAEGAYHYIQDFISKNVH